MHVVAAIAEARANREVARAAAEAEYERLLREYRDGIPNAPAYSSASPAYYLANRLSYAFDFRGPSEAINLNCASGAGAVNRAVQSLANAESDLAVVAGGVSLVVPEGWRVKFEGNMFGGGFSDVTRTTADEDAPTVTISGFILLGGLQATTRSPIEEAA
mgnify:CR=1 FL=1